MADGTKIEWTDATWTPVKGCTRVSPGCGGPGPHGGCYAEIMAARFSKPGQWGEGLAEIVTLPDGRKDHRWTGNVRFDEAELLKPLRWKRPRKIFVCSTADLFHEKVEDEWIDRVFAVMALCPQHTFQVLTKRPERMRAWFKRMDGGPLRWAADILSDAAYDIGIDEDSCVSVANWINGFSRWRHAPVDDNPLDGSVVRWPLPNVWLGTSVEDQKRADERIPHLLATPAAVRWLSCEPLLGPVDLTDLTIRVAPGEEPCGLAGLDALTGLHWDAEDTITGICGNPDPRIDWVVVGGESGPGARPMHPDWARSLRDQCAAAGAAFHFKQIGEWGWPTIEQHHEDYAAACNGERPWPGDLLMEVDGTTFPGTSMQIGQRAYIRKMGKKAAGRLLDGVQHDGFPQQGRGE